MEIKVGDRVQGEESDGSGVKFTGTVFQLTGVNSGTIDRDDGKEGSGVMCPTKGHKGWSFSNLSDYKLELINEGNKTMNLKEQFLLALKQEPEKTYRKVGLTDASDMLTPDGQAIFLTYLLSKTPAFKTDVADGMLAELEKTNK